MTDEEVAAVVSCVGAVAADWKLAGTQGVVVRHAKLVEMALHRG
jgi:hypothetical protein